MRLLVTGGAGYVGSHAAWAAVDAGHEVVVVDNLSTGHRDLPPPVELVELDLLDAEGLSALLARVRPDAVLHFAARAQVGESVAHPDRYFRTNVVGSLNLLEAMRDAECGRLVFSSTAAVYGEPESTPIREDAAMRPTNPYGRSKRMVEELLEAWSDRGWVHSIALRYFNAAGADAAGRTGERHDPETHLIPNALLAAAGKRSRLKLFGTDYPTRDGTCVRDYVHVSDLADAHLRAIDWLEDGTGAAAINLGTGTGYTVREVLTEAAAVVGAPLVFDEVARRPGDPAVLVASFERATEILGWSPQRDLREILASAWEWHRR
ncbi:MAG: UDP-glucose 4-epimerase GalE [Deltaproteobacteria bacterium]|nr:MAG: UDP-glucose 4-epimerase GalE [Deltaproteobacteria bacterium]